MARWLSLAVVAWLILDPLPGLGPADPPGVVALGARQASRGTTVLVSAAVSLTEVLQTIARAYERGERGERIVLNLAGSNTLARQIAEGAPVDLFISADAAQMDRVEQAGRILAGSRVDLLSNQLVVVVPDDRARLFRSPRDLLDPEIGRIAVGDPAAVPAGVYAKQYLEAQGLWPQLRAKIVPTMSVRGTLSAVEAGNADAGIVYRTDAAIATRAVVALAVPVEDGPSIDYPAAVMVDAPNQAGARRFLAHLQGPDAAAAFERAGFIVRGTRN